MGNGVRFAKTFRCTHGTVTAVNATCAFLALCSRNGFSIRLVCFKMESLPMCQSYLNLVSSYLISAFAFLSMHVHDNNYSFSFMC